jgi:dTDP-4-amino-4,6-dideoxygalactose transaminase
VCSRHGIEVVEDAAEALGATFVSGALAERHVGTVGRLGCFSFNGNKIITTGGGGMIVTDHVALARTAKHLTTQARIPGRAYDHDDVGYNYRLTNLAAALGVAQLEALPQFVAKKRQIAARYDAAFTGHPAIERAPNAPWAAPSSWLYSITLAPLVERDQVLDCLASSGIEARPLWTPLHRMAPFKNAPRVGDGRVAESIAFRGLSLPSSVSLSEADQDRVIATVLEATTLASSG